MFLDGWQRALLTVCASLALAGCDDSKKAPTPETPDEPGPMAEPEPDPMPDGLTDELVPSRKARVKFKGGERYARDLAASLDLPRDQICSELGRYDCVAVHAIALGGVEPYELGIDEPLETAPISAAIAAERVALSACSARVDADLADPANAVLVSFAAAEPTVGEREALAADLFDRILRRDATPDELTAVAAFYDEVAAESDAPARDWARLSCLSIATMLEALFY